MPLLARDHHVVAIDLLGQGDSGESVTGYDTWSIAASLSDLMGELTRDPFVLIGHDVGAWVAYAFAHRFPEQLRGVGLLNADIGGVNLELEAETHFGAWHFVFNRVPELPEVLFAGHEREVIEWFFTRAAADWQSTFTREDIDEYVRVLSRPTSLRGMLGYYRAVPANTIKNEELGKGRLLVPVLAMDAVRSSNTLADGLAHQSEDLRSVVFEGIGHYAAEEAPERVASTLATFIESLEDRPMSLSDASGRPLSAPFSHG